MTFDSPVVGTVVEQAPSVPQKWEHALLDCCATGGSVVCCSVLCAPCLVGSVQGRLEGSPDGMDTVLCTDVIGATLLGSLISPAASCLACWCSYASFTFWQRLKVRQQYNIKGDFFGDCLTAFCCTPCTATLNYTQLASDAPVHTQVGYAVAQVCRTADSVPEAEPRKL